MLTAQCLCGAVEIDLTAKPTHINDCNCTLCRKSGGAWGYYKSADVTVTGETVGSVRTDMDEPSINLHRCPKCGTTTHWVLTDSAQAKYPDVDRVGVNMRLFNPDELIGVEVRFPDGLNWTKPIPDMRRPPQTIGADWRW